MALLCSGAAGLALSLDFLPGRDQPRCVFVDRLSEPMNSRSRCSTMLAIVSAVAPPISSSALGTHPNGL